MFSNALAPAPGAPRNVNGGNARLVVPLLFGSGHVSFRRGELHPLVENAATRAG